MPIPFLAPDDELTPFPDVDTALTEPDGLLMAGGSLSPRRLLSAYRAGVFPWYEAGEPILWWSPSPRCVIWPDDLRVTRSLAKTIRGGRYEVTENVAFRDVMKLCGAPRAGSSGTWITDEMIDAYCELHRAGIAHSLETWLGDRLVGGLYGIALGQVFIGESMFSTERDASKIALVHLTRSARYRLIDCQLETPHLKSMGANSIERSHYIRLLEAHGDLANETINPDSLFGPPDPGFDRPGEVLARAAASTSSGDVHTQVPNEQPDDEAAVRYVQVSRP